MPTIIIIITKIKFIVMMGINIFTNGFLIALVILDTDKYFLHFQIGLF